MQSTTTTKIIINDADDQATMRSVRVVAKFFNCRQATSMVVPKVLETTLPYVLENSSPLFDDLACQLQAAFGIWKRRNLVIRYKDPEGDLITLTNDVELQEAIRCLQDQDQQQQPPTLQLFVSRVGGAQQAKQQETQPTTAPTTTTTIVGVPLAPVKKNNNKTQDPTATATATAPKPRSELLGKLELLEAAGFTNRPQNKRLLVKFEGDVEEVKLHLQGMQEREEALAKLLAMGYPKKGRNLALLHKFQNDVDQVVAFLQKTQQEREERLQRGKQRKLKLMPAILLEETRLPKESAEESSSAVPKESAEETSTEVPKAQLADCSSSSSPSCTSSSEEEEEKGSTEQVTKGMEEALKTLQEQGFKRRRQNMRLLLLFDGDVTKVIAFLQCRKDRKKGLHQKLKVLRESGFDRSLQNRRLLNKFDGDVDKVKAYLEQREEALHQLESMGFNRQGLNLRLLNKHDGDLLKVVQILLRKEEKACWRDEREHWRHHRRSMRKCSDF